MESDSETASSLKRPANFDSFYDADESKISDEDGITSDKKEYTQKAISFAHCLSEINATPVGLANLHVSEESPAKGDIGGIDIFSAVRGRGNSDSKRKSFQLNSPFHLGIKQAIAIDSLKETHSDVESRAEFDIFEAVRGRGKSSLKNVSQAELPGRDKASESFPNAQSESKIDIFEPSRERMESSPKNSSQLDSSSQVNRTFDLSSNKEPELDTDIVDAAQEHGESIQKKDRVSCTEEFVEASDELDLTEDLSFSVSDTPYPEINSERNELLRKKTIFHGKGSYDLYFQFDYLELAPVVARRLRYNKIFYLSSCQSLCIPVVLAKRNLLLVGAASTQKTSACIIPTISNLLLDDFTELKSLQGLGPRCVFLTADSRRATYLSRLCFLYCGKRLTTIVSGGSEKAKDLSNGCEILVTTPKNWIRLLSYPSVTTMSRLCYVVFDCIDNLMNLFPEEIDELMKRIHLTEKIRLGNNCLMKIQHMFIAETWTNNMVKLLPVLDDPVVCITSFKESCIYAQIRPSIRLFKDPDKRYDRIKEMIQSTQPMKTVVVCRNQEEATKLNLALIGIEQKVLVVHERMHKNLVSGVVPIDYKVLLETVDAAILICTGQFAALGMPTADWLIHFSVPDSQSGFIESFSVLRKHFPDRTDNPSAPPPKCLVDTFVIQKDISVMPGLVDFMERLNAVVPKNLQNIVRMLKSIDESGKPLCENILQFGSCSHQQGKCKSRHEFNETDLLPKYLDKGLLKYQILNIHTPVKFTVRPLGLKRGGAEWTRFKSDFVPKSLLLGIQFSRRKRDPCCRPVIGGIVGVETTNGLEFKIARILEITKREKFTPTEVKIKILDDGTSQIIQVDRLIDLPHELKNLVSDSFDIYCGSLVPTDFDTSWSNEALSFIKNLIQKVTQSAKMAPTVFLSEILLAAGNSLIVENVFHWRRLTAINSFFMEVDVFKHLIEHGFAQKNVSHLTRLGPFCRDDEIDVDLIDVNRVGNTCEKVKKELPQFTTACLPLDMFVEVAVTAVHNPSNFYVIQPKFSQLVRDIEEEMERSEVKTHVKDFDVGNLCMIKKHGRWYRAMIVRNDIEDEQSLLLCTVFYSDIGMVSRTLKNNVYAMPRKFMQLPFQAINCRLASVEPIDPEAGWNAIATTALLNFCFSSGPAEKSIAARALSSEPSDSITKSRYDVVLIAIPESGTTAINMVLTQGGSARWVDGPDSTLESLAGLNCLLKNNIKATNKREKLNEVIEVNRLCERLSAADWGIIFPELKERYEAVKQRVEEMVLPAQKKVVQKSNQITNHLDHPKRNAEGNECESFDSELELDEIELDVPQLVRLHTIVPSVSWCDDEFKIFIKVHLPHLEYYTLSWTSSYITFRTESNSKMYWFVIQFFGPIRSVKHALNGMYVWITAEKQVELLFWPRLSYTNLKTHKITFDQDREIELGSSDEIQRHYTKGTHLVDLHSDWVRCEEKEPVQDPDSSEGELGYDSDDGDYNPYDIPDPHNPLI